MGALQALFGGHSLQEFATGALVAAVLTALTYTIGCMVYNAYFHPLSNHPGPKLWAATRLPWCYYQYNGVLAKKLLELHNQYGTTVRVAPTEVSYTTESAWKTIYGARTDEMGKDPIFSLTTPSKVQNLLTADRPTHIRQRRLLSHAFSEKALREQESILMTYANILMEKLSAQSSKGYVNIVDWFNYITCHVLTVAPAYDMIGDLSFGERFGCLDREGYDPFVGAITHMAKEISFAQMVRYYGLAGLRQYFLPKAIQGARMANLRRVTETVDRRINRETSRKDFLHYILAANEDKALSRPEIYVNAFSFSIAGSESSATALCSMVYFILTHPVTYKRACDEVRGAFAAEHDITLASTVPLKYLDAVINEALRLHPPVAITFPRVVPRGGETVDGRYVPEGTTVGINTYTTFRYYQNFHRPTEYAPERWLPADTLGRDAGFAADNATTFQPFSYGPRNCLGKNLAKAEMRLIASKLLFKFDLKLAAGSEGWESKQKLWGFWVKPPLMVALTPREGVSS